MSALVTPDWLEARLHDPVLRIIEASIEKSAYDAAHIPGALWVDTHRELLLQPDDSSGYIITPEQFAALMSRLAVTPEMTVVWYGDRHSSFAIRGLWTMDYYAHPGAVHVLDGGRERWLLEGRPTTSQVPNVRPSPYPLPPRVDASNRATIEDVRSAIDAADRVVLDVRALDEYTGENLRAARGGHIPGAAHVEWTDATVGPNVLKSPEELRAMYEAEGVTPDKEIIAHCQLGIRSAHTWFVLKHVLGYPHVRSYDGSWQEWGNRDDTPIERS
ncbi:MAG TPA: sulfurtransferase [Gemmatimonadaceae bacterium]